VKAISCVKMEIITAWNDIHENQATKQRAIILTIRNWDRHNDKFKK